MRFLVTTFVLWWVVAGALAEARCKCSIEDSCWPDESDWKALNATIDGRLIKTVLPASVCYTSEPNYDAAACAKVREDWKTSAFHSGDPASLHSPVGANNSCNPIYPNGTSLTGDVMAGDKGCTMGLYPPYVVNATKLSHVREAVKFSAKRGIRLNVKNTGHNARSRGFSSLSIWTHNIRGFETHQHWVPQCKSADKPKPRAAATIGAGERDAELFKAAAAEGLAVVGGTDGDVGFMGWATGGGHGYLTSEFGQGADNILEIVIVVPSGEVLVANECQNTDIFWAVRGGGGGTFGVIVEATIATHPMPRTTLWQLTMSSKAANCTSCWYELMADLHTYLPEMKKGGFQGYYNIIGPPSSKTLSFTGSWFLYNSQNGTAQQLAAPLLGHLKSTTKVADFQSSFYEFPTWYDAFKTFPSDLGQPGGGGGAITSRLLSARALTNDTNTLARTLELMGPRAEGNQAGVSNPSFTGAMSISSRHADNALNPAWRDSVVHALATVGWSDMLGYAQITSAVDENTNVKGAALRQLDPQGPVYLNEADGYQPDWKTAFWGVNYNRLLTIERKYDPENMLWCHHCVGSEAAYEELDGRLCNV